LALIFVGHGGFSPALWKGGEPFTHQLPEKKNKLMTEINNKPVGLGKKGFE